MDPRQPFPDSRTFSTRLVHARVLGRRLGLEQLHLKLEGENPTGSHKDRAAERIVAWALADRVPGVTIGTCGNFGVAVAGAARRAGLSSRVYVPARYHGPQIASLEASGVRLVRTEGGYEEAVEASQAFARQEGWFDANPPGRGGLASIEAYGTLASELLAQAPGRIESLWIPNGNGTTLTGIYRRLLERSATPKLGACGSRGNTALTASLAADRVVELDPASLRETPENEPLLNWRSYHAAEALEIFRRVGGWIHDATDEELLRAQRWIFEDEDLRTTAASAAALAGLVARRENMVDPAGVHVVLLTS